MTKLKLHIAGTKLSYEGEEEFLETKVVPLLEALTKSHNEQVKSDLLEVHGELQQDLASMESHVSSMSRLNEELSRTVKEFSDKSRGFFERIGALQNDQAALLNATKQMQETQMSFNLQYLQLQSQMQNENRQFSMVSNIMKTKHDTVKNSISNIR